MKIRLTSPDGRAVTVEVTGGKLTTDYKGFTGPSCEVLANEAEARMASGKTLSKREHKAEYYQGQAEGVWI